MVSLQWTYNGLTFGSSTDIDVIRVAGLGGPAIASNDATRPQVDGLFPGVDLARGRTISFELEPLAADDAALDALLASIRKATNPRRTGELPLTMQLQGQTPRRINCRCRRREIPWDLTYLYRVPTVFLDFFATDPRIYDDTASNGSTAITVPGTGLAFNATPPFSFGGATSGGQIPVSNAGDFAAPWTATITGPVTDPRLDLLSTGQRLSLVGTVASGDTLTLDSQARSIILNGTASRYSMLQAGSQWFDLPVGSDTVTFGATSGTGSLSLTWRSAWM